MNSGPTLKIEKDAIRYVEDACIDSDIYTQYLQERKVPESDILNHELLITNNDIPRTAEAVFIQAIFKDETHQIIISPTRSPRYLHDQGNMLRHESEHFIQCFRKLARFWMISRVSTAALSVCGTGAFFGKEGMDIAENIVADYPSILKAGGMAIGAIAGGPIGGALGWYGYQGINNEFSIKEFQARRAEKKQQLALPDGVLQIAFK